MTIYVRVFTLTILITLLILSYKFYLSPTFTISIHPITPTAEKEEQTQKRTHIEVLTEKAKKGDAKAQNDLGSYYEIGTNVIKDINKSLYWYGKAASQNYVPAQERLANIYFSDKKDYDRAFPLCLKLAEQGNTPAQGMLGYMYHNGKGTLLNHQKALYWYTQAANKGNKTAQYNLGNMYRSGEGVTKNAAKAFYLYKEAAEQEIPEAQHSLGKAYETGLGTKKDLKQAGYWYKKAADNGLTFTQQYLTDTNTHCLKNTKITQNKAEGCIIAAAAKFPEAQKKLVTIYHEGLGVNKNDVEAYAWYIAYAWPLADENFKNTHKDLTLEQQISAFIASKTSPYIRTRKAAASTKAKEYAQKYSAQ